MPLIQPEKEAAGPVEDEGDGKADKQGLQSGQQRPASLQQTIHLQQHRHQQHGVGDEQNQTFEQLFVHGYPS